jgi:hypothetical protein
MVGRPTTGVVRHRRGQSPAHDLPASIVQFSSRIHATLCVLGGSMLCLGRETTSPCQQALIYSQRPQTQPVPLTAALPPVTLNGNFKDKSFGREIHSARAGLASGHHGPGLPHHQGLQRSLHAICDIASGGGHGPRCAYRQGESQQVGRRRIPPRLHVHARGLFLGVYDRGHALRIAFAVQGFKNPIDIARHNLHIFF